MKRHTHTHTHKETNAKLSLLVEVKTVSHFHLTDYGTKDAVSDGMVVGVELPKEQEMGVGEGS